MVSLATVTPDITGDQHYQFSCSCNFVMYLVAILHPGEACYRIEARYSVPVQVQETSAHYI